jgi:hypothetical protein
MDVHTMIMRLKKLFDEASRKERYETSKELFHCKTTEGYSVNTHVLKMISYIEKLDQLGFVMDHELSIELILQSLPQSFSQFIMNYHMNKLDSTLKLFNMLKTAERALKKEKDLVLLVQSSRMSKKKDKNNKGVVSKVNKLTRSIKKDKGICYHYGKEGY